MRKLNVFCCFAALLAACACGGGSSSNKKDKLPPQEMTLAKGSGRQCPLVAGDYLCTVTKAEKDAGTDSYFMQVRQTLNGANQTYLGIENPTFSGILLADGEIRRVNEHDSTIQYSVDCQANALSWHIVADHRYNTVATIYPRSQTAAAFDTVTFENGETTRIHRDCNFDPKPPVRN